MILPTERKSVKLPLARVHPDPTQPRKAFDWDKLKDLAASIRNNGQWVDVIVRPDTELPDDFILVDGERRWRAMPLVPQDTVNATVVAGPLDPGQLLMAQMSLGLTSERLDVLEVGEGSQKLMQMYDLTYHGLAERLGTTASTITKLFRIVEGIPEELRPDVKSGALPFTVAYHIARLKDVPTKLAIAEKFKAGLLKRDSVEAAVRAILDPALGRAKSPKPVTARTLRGLQAVLPPLDHDGVLAELASLADAVKRCQKHGLPLSSVPQLLKA